MLTPDVTEKTEPLQLQVETAELAPPARPKQPHKTARKLLRWGIVLLALVGLGIAAKHYFGASAKVTYTSVPLDRGDIEAAVTATGNANAVVTVQVGSQVSGNIAALYADFNTVVKKGQLVARIDPASLQAKVNQTQAAVDSAKSSVASSAASVKKAEADIAGAVANVSAQQAAVARAQSAVDTAKTQLDRRLELFKGGLIAAEDRDTAQAAYDQAVASLAAAKDEVTAAQAEVAAEQSARDSAKTLQLSAQASVKQATATLQQAQLDLAHTEIRAPVDGTVISRNMDVGQTVAASFSAPTIFQIAQDVTKMQVDANIDESDIGRVKPGQAATFTVDSYPGVTFKGVVRQVRQAPINVQNVITYDVVIDVPNEDMKLFPGMTANVKIVIDHVQNALRVPNSAMRFRPADLPAPKRNAKASPADQAVYVLGKDGKPQQVPVRVGLTDGNYSEVTAGGLTEGQQVIVSSGNPKPAR